MLRKLNTHVTPSSLLAIVALFVSLGGVSYAAATIGSAEIKDNSVKSKDVRNKTLVGKDVKPNALGGNQIDESTLGQVPTAVSATTATQADTATNATNAQTAAAVGPDGVNGDSIQDDSVDATDLGAHCRGERQHFDVPRRCRRVVESAVRMQVHHGLPVLRPGAS